MKRTADVLSVLFRWPVLSKAFECLVSLCLGRFMERSGFQPLSCTFALLCVRPIHCEVCWKVGRRPILCRLILVQSLIGSAIKIFSISSGLWVWLPSKICSVGNFFLSNRSHHVMLHGCRSKLINFVSEVQQAKVGLVVPPVQFGALLHIFSSLSVDDSTSTAVLPSQGIWLAVTESLNRDLNKVSEQCNLGMVKLNVSKTKTMIVSRSNTMGMCRKGLMTLKYWEWDLILRWLWEESSLGFQSNLSKAWYLEVLASI